MLEIFGIIFLIVIGKFVYDTYMSNNTEKNWKKFKDSYPEKAAQIQNNSGLNFRTPSIKPQFYKNMTELQQILIRLSLELYKKVENRQQYFEFSYDNNRNLEQYLKSICSILSAAIIEAALDLDNIGKNEDIRRQLKLNLRQSYLTFANSMIKTNKIIFPEYHLSKSNDDALTLYAVVKMEKYADGIKHYLSTGRHAYLEIREDYDDDGDLYEYAGELQYAFVQDIYEVGFDQIRSSLRVNFGELKYEIEESQTEISSLLFFIRSCIKELRGV